MDIGAGKTGAAHFFDEQMVLEDEEVIIQRPDIVILEGLNVLSTGVRPDGTPPRTFVSDYVDFSIYEVPLVLRAPWRDRLGWTAAGAVTVNAGMSRFSGVVQADTYLQVGETIRPVRLDGDRRGYVIATADTSAVVRPSLRCSSISSPPGE